MTVTIWHLQEFEKEGAQFSCPILFVSFPFPPPPYPIPLFHPIPAPFPILSLFNSLFPAIKWTPLIQLG